MRKRTPEFGFSAFLRLLDAKENPQRAAIQKRYRPSKGGHNFHRSFHVSVRKILTGEASFVEVFRATRNIKKLPERRYTKFGIVRFLRWYLALKSKATLIAPLKVNSPKSLFRVKFQADCVVDLDGRRTAIHLWNSKKKINEAHALAALTLVASNFPPTKDRPDDFAVLSLQDGSLYKWSSATRTHKQLVTDFMVHLDRLFDLVRSELGIPSMGDQPSDDAHL